jgi:hypothetical protein
MKDLTVSESSEVTKLSVYQLILARNQLLDFGLKKLAL